MVEDPPSRQAQAEERRTGRSEENKKRFAYIVLDEIHNIPKWEKWIRIMLEKRKH